jgi:eukaryotic-like serine/threonine-protein kinase
VLLRATLPLHSEALHAATTQSRGNPLFALQLVHAWAGGGYLTMEEGRYRVPKEALSGRAITTAELWDERLRAVPTELRLAAYAAAAIGDDARGVVLKALATSLGLDAREALLGLTRAQILVPSGNDQFRWAHALLQEHLLARLHERNDHPAIFRLAANALALHPSVGSRRVMKLRVTNLLRAGDDDVAANLMIRFIEASWSRGRDTAATLRDLSVLEGRVQGAMAAEYAFWRAEALRHTGMLERAKEQAEKALNFFEAAGDESRIASAMRLLGHIASDVGQPAPGRISVQKALLLFQKLGDARGVSQAKVVLGEIEYLLGAHSAASELLRDAAAACRAVGDDLGAAQALILLAMIRNSEGGYTAAVKLLMEARVAFDLIGYRLGIAQCDAVLGHADHRARKFDTAMARAVMARDAFRELMNPRGEAASERLLAMACFDTNDLPSAEKHVDLSLRLFEKLHDPWGILEMRLLRIQIGLLNIAASRPRMRSGKTKSDVAVAEALAAVSAQIAECDAMVLDEAEPRQHRHLTRAWFLFEQGLLDAAIQEVRAAREVFGTDSIHERVGDHTPQLLDRLTRLAWPEEHLKVIHAWRTTLLAQDRADQLPPSSQWPTAQPT